MPRNVLHVRASVCVSVSVEEIEDVPGFCTGLVHSHTPSSYCPHPPTPYPPHPSPLALSSSSQCVDRKLHNLSIAVGVIVGICRGQNSKINNKHAKARAHTG